MYVVDLCGEIPPKKSIRGSVRGRECAERCTPLTEESVLSSTSHNQSSLRGRECARRCTPLTEESVLSSVSIIKKIINQIYVFVYLL